MKTLRTKLQNMSVCRSLLLTFVWMMALVAKADSMVGTHYFKTSDGQQVWVALDPTDNKKAWIAPTDSRFISSASYNKNCVISGQLDIPAEVRLENYATVTIVGVAKYGLAYSKITGFTLPSTVSTLDEYAFSGCMSLKNITIPSTVTTVAYGAFQGCSEISIAHINSQGMLANANSQVFGMTKLQALYIGDNVTSIGSSSFSSSSTLSFVQLGAAVESIGNRAFANTKITHIKLPASIKSIDSNAFLSTKNPLKRIDIESEETYQALVTKSIQLTIPEGCSIYLNGRDMTASYRKAIEDPIQPNPNNEPKLEDGATEIPSNFFTSSTAKRITIPSTVKTICDNAFNSSKIEEITIPSTVTEIGQSAFANCSNLKRVVIEAPIETLRNNTFVNCTSLEQIVLPATLKKIESMAFSECSSLAAINLPNGLQSIGSMAFYDCSSLTNVVIPASVTDFNSFAFSCCVSPNNTGFSLTFLGNQDYDFSDGLLYNRDHTILYNSSNSLEPDIIVPQGVKKISESALFNYNAIYAINNYDYYKLPVINLPASLEEFISSSANSISFGYALSYNVDAANQHFCSVDGVLYSKDKRTLLALPYLYEGDTFIIPQTVDSVCIGAFQQIGRQQRLHTIVLDHKLNRMNDQNAVQTLLYTSSYFYFLPQDYVDLAKGTLSSLYSYYNIYPYEEEGIVVQARPNDYAGMVLIYAAPKPCQAGEVEFQECVVDGKSYPYDSKSKSFSLIGFYSSSSTKGTIYYTINGESKIEEVSFRPNSFPLDYDQSDGKKYFEKSYTSITANCILKNGFRYEGYMTRISQLGAEYYVIGGKDTISSSYTYQQLKEQDWKFSITASSLAPGQSVGFRQFFVMDGQKFYYRLYTEQTASFDITLQELSYGPTSVKAVYDFDPMELSVISAQLVGSKKDTPNVVTGLTPGETVLMEYQVTLLMPSGRDTLISKSIYVVLPELQMKTLPAKATSNTKAVLQAQTNITPDETNTGYEWRRYDAPDLVPSYISPTTAWNGVLEGTLSNLSPNTYYKYRPYYKSQSGEMYYGDWLAFGTADAYAYFEPSVHTAEIGDIGDDSCTLLAYVVEGSDDIIQQGFEYWPTTNVSALRLRISANFVAESDNGDNMHQRVAGEGTPMVVTLTGLMPGTTYNVRAYVVTARATTYGETMSFTTSGTNAVGNIGDDNGNKIVTRYDLSGQAASGKKKGITIVRMSDGTIRKIKN